MQEEVYKGYTIIVNNKAYKIIEFLSTGKKKVRRESACNQYTGKRNQYGDKLYTPFESDEQAMDRAKNYVDNHIKPWAERLKELGREK